MLRNRQGVAATVVAFGARLARLMLPDARGRSADIVLGFDTPAEYDASDAYIGATCGRYASRIRDGTFALDGATYPLTRNEGRHHAHGGRSGFDRKLWRAQANAARERGRRSRISRPTATKAIPARSTPG